MEKMWTLSFPVSNSFSSVWTTFRIDDKIIVAVIMAGGDSRLKNHRYGIIDYLIHLMKLDF